MKYTMSILYSANVLLPLSHTVLVSFLGVPKFYACFFFNSSSFLDLPKEKPCHHHLLASLEFVFFFVYSTRLLN